MVDIKVLLKRKKLTGQDLGRIEIASMSLRFKDELEGNEDSKPLIETNKLQAMINSLNDKKELQMYNNYIEVHDWISLKYNISQTHLQQAQLQLKYILSLLSEFLLIEEFYTYISNLQLKDKPPIPKIIETNSLTYLINNNDELQNNIEKILSAREIFLGSYYFMINYNLVLDMIAEEYGIPEINIFKRNFSKLHEQIKLFNDTRNEIYSKIQNEQYINTQKIKQEKLNILQKYFDIINISNIRAPQDNISKVKYLLKDFKAFKIPTNDPIYDLLFIR